MRILHVSEVSWGGVVSLIREFTDQQLRRGHDVCLLAPDISPKIAGVQLRPWSLQRANAGSYPKAYKELRAAVEEFQPDVIHLHSFVAGFLGRLPFSVGSTPVVYQPHAWSFDLRDHPAFHKVVAGWESFAGRRTKLLVTNCQDEINEGRAAGVTTEGRVIGVAVDTARFAEVDEGTRQRYREELGITSRRMLLCVGRLVRQKGQDLLVAAWENNAPPDTELILLGPGDTESLQSLAPQQWGRSIRAVGEHPDVRPWLWACDALILSSRYEGEAVVVAEALASGRPVIATNVNGANNAIRGGVLPAAGRVVEIGDMTALLAESRDMLDKPSLAVEMSSSARQRAENLFSAKAVADRLDAAYAEAIGHPITVPTQRRPAETPAPARPRPSRSRL